METDLAAASTLAIGMILVTVCCICLRQRGKLSLWPAAGFAYNRLKMSAVRLRGPWCAALVLAAVLPPALAQVLPEIVAPAEPPDRQMVNLNLVALDSHGQPVPDLRAEDLRITDNGKAQTVALFRRRMNTAAEAFPAVPNGFTNRSSENIPGATLILFDLMNETLFTRGTAASELEKVLVSVDSPDHLYLYLVRLDGQLYPVHGLPGPEDRPAVAGAPPWTREAKPLLEKALRETPVSRPMEQRHESVGRVQLAFRALDAIATELARVPGYKSIVWVTDGIPIELGPQDTGTGHGMDFTPLIRQMSEAMNRSQVAIYPVRQVMLGSTNNVNRDNGEASISTLNLFAALTGGRPDAGKDIGAALKQALTDMRTSYQVGYYPPDMNWDHKLHKLKVTTTRKGVTIRSRTAYYAWHDPRGARGEQAVNSVSRSAFDAAEIGLAGSLSRVPGGFRLDARIDARDVALIPAGGYYDGHLVVAILGYAQGALSQPRRLVPLDIHLSAAAYDRARELGLPYIKDLTFYNLVQVLRVIVFDRGTEAVGSLTIPLPPPAR